MHALASYSVEKRVEERDQSTNVWHLSCLTLLDEVGVFDLRQRSLEGWLVSYLRENAVQVPFVAFLLHFVVVRVKLSSVGKGLQTRRSRALISTARGST